MSSKEAELIKRRAIAFLKNAQQLYTQEVYDLAAFNLEQHCGLLLKYLLFYYGGFYPKTHSLTELIQRLQRFKKELGELLQGENLLYITKLEDAYVNSRLREYSKEEVGLLLKFVKEVFDKYVEA
ncbi:hypothetical protein B9Q11_02365 [Candidatus Marsarchaeota G2 archaeon ECH_B_SAG-F08]|uniref:HEPN domain-containing protein n=1 Tax=Candidatus Marsarchaeota G2 archaeon ECH_B_SAG-F08 TaxID=1978165 RepID=A0A2R6BIE9_9ARCH|nr:MAG: hypothetical protein B9Q11_02365 [Candidatus Marsarchaeota G2 archaeon ECH_B_SAG-F08]